ncbi:MAG: FmdB family zinc ribbon protein [Acidimicrobiia bacterium]
MPTYEYRCRDCGEDLEVVQSFNDDPLTECPSCSGPLRKIFGSVGIAFKGTGFYKTDNRHPRGKPKKEGGESSGSDDKASSGSSDKGSSDKGSSEKGSSEKSSGSSDKGSSDSSSSGGSGSSSGTKGKGTRAKTA